MSRGGEFGGLWGRRRSRQGGHLLCHDQLWGLDWLRATAPLRALAVSSVLFLLPGVVIQIKSSQVDAHKKVFFSCCWRFTHIRVSQDTRGRRNRGGSGKCRNLGGRWGVTSPPAAEPDVHGVFMVPARPWTWAPLWEVLARAPRISSWAGSGPPAWRAR